ncbi:MAG: acetolactate synthase large subunit, partial [Candidatus Zixiibacteriota bacterium]
MFRPITKWNASIQNPNVVTEVVRKAFKLAEMEKPGATHFELPEDVAKMECHEKPIPPKRLRRAAPDYKAMNEAYELLKKSKMPLILAGNGAIRKLASKHLREWVKKTGIPVVHTFMGKGAVSDMEEHSLFAVGLQARDYVMRAFDKADLVITVGYDVAEYDPEFWNRNKDKKIIHIDFQQAEVYEYYQPDVEIVCDVSAALCELNKHDYNGDLKFDREWYKPIREKIRTDLDSYALKDSDDFTVPGVLHIIREIMNPGDILISDVGSHKLWVGRNYPVCHPNSVLISNGFASMGIALPGGIAAKLAKPEKQVVAVMGDGGFLMNSQEIETARRIGVGYTIIVFNDNDYGLVSWKQYSHTRKTFGTGLTNPDFKKYAESFGIPAYAPKTLKELKSDLKKAITGQKLCLVEIAIQPRVNYELSEKLERDLS